MLQQQTMVSGNKKWQNGNIFLRMHPLQRLALSIVLAAATFFVTPKSTGSLITFMYVWLTFALVYLITGWIILFTRPVGEIRKWAKKDDGSKVFVFLMVLLSSFTSIIIVLLIMISKDISKIEQGKFVFVSTSGIVLSWFMVHTLYAFHYAHMYYDEAENDNSRDAEGLDFPQKEDPDYIDFAYFSFVIGCTFQVSDVEINSREIRRSVFGHQLIAFFLNTFVVALSINLVAGLMK